MKQEDPHLDPSDTKSISWKIALPVCLLILAIAGGVVTAIHKSEPTAEREGATRRTAMLVDVTRAEGGTFNPVIKAMGRVEAAQDVMLSPQVSGEIVDVSPKFIPGNRVARGDILLRIDPTDYENAVAQARSRLRQAEADLAVEMGRQAVAEQDFELLGEQVAENNRSLILREPQLNVAKAAVESAEAALARAERDLERTVIRAPFDAQILSRAANIGSQVSGGTRLGRLIGLDEYWVMATVPLSQLKWIAFPEGDAVRGAPVRIRNRTAWNPGEYREAYVSRLIGTLDDRTRLARVLVVVKDPLAQQSQNSDAPRMILDAIVEAEIAGRPLENVVRIDRDHLREDDTVWVNEAETLAIRSVDVVFRDARFAYISSGLQAGEQVITTNLATVVEGTGVRVEDEKIAANLDT